MAKAKAEPEPELELGLRRPELERRARTAERRRDELDDEATRRVYAHAESGAESCQGSQATTRAWREDATTMRRYGGGPDASRTRQRTADTKTTMAKAKAEPEPELELELRRPELERRAKTAERRRDELDDASTHTRSRRPRAAKTHRRRRGRGARILRGMGHRLTGLALEGGASPRRDDVEALYEMGGMLGVVC